MCGIAGFIDKGRVTDKNSVLKLMADKMFHRGPDAVGYYSDESCGLAHRRLKIIDLSDQANQPMIDPVSKNVLIFNGEIYNYRELRESLQQSGCVFNTSSDTEVLLKGLSLHGESFISQLEGDFAFVFRSVKKNLFLMARDRFGIKPLYTYRDGVSLFFSSEIQPLFAAGIEKSLHIDLVAEYFRYRYVAGEDTLFKNIKHFPPGHFLKIQDGAEVLSCYYNRADHKQRKKTPFAESFRQAVDDRLNADVDVGLFLSAGIDSSSIAAQAYHLEKQISTFTYSFNIQDDILDESAAANALAEKFGFKNIKIIDSGNYLLYPKIIKSLEEPIGDAIILANDALFSATKKNAGVALSGEGADELFSSYAHHRTFSIVKAIQKSPALRRFCKIIIKTIPLAFLNKISFYPVKLNNGLKTRILKALDAKSDSEVFKNFACLFSEEELKQLLKSNYREDRNFFTDSVQSTDFKNWLPKYGLLRVDKLSMAHSLEVRLPFLSHFVVDSVLNSSWSKPKIFSRDKSEFRRFCQATLKLPAGSTQQKKQPFFSPASIFFPQNYRNYVREVLSAVRMKKFNVLNTEYVLSLLDDPNPDFILIKKINSILIFQIWCEEFF